MLTFRNGSSPGASVSKFMNWKLQTDVFEDVAAYDFGGPGLNLTGGAFLEQVQGISVTADYFRLFGAVICLLVGVVFGLIPALDASRADLNLTLKESSGRSGTASARIKLALCW